MGLVKFTANISAIERHALRAQAAREGSTMNFVLRIAIRDYLGMDALKRSALELSGETVETGNNGAG